MDAPQSRRSVGGSRLPRSHRRQRAFVRNIDMGSTIAIRNTVAPPPDAFPASRLIGWRALLESSAHTLAATLPIGVPVDLMRDFAAPWSLDLAVGATQGRASAADRLDLAALAHDLSRRGAY